MTPLALDMARCHPIHADVWCQQCKRWADHPFQTWGPRTPAWNASGPEDQNCAYIPSEKSQAEILKAVPA